MKFRAFLLLLAVSIAPATFAKDTYIDTSDASRQTALGLYPVVHSKLDIAFAKPDLDLSAYDQFILDPVAITYRDTRPRREPGSSRRMRSQLNDDETQEMQQIFNEIFSDKLSADETFSVVSEASEGTLRITPLIADLVINVPLDPTAGRSRIYVNSVADMTLVLEFRDALSGELLAQVADRGDARSMSRTQLSTPVSNRREVERLLDHWATVLHDRLRALVATPIETR